jgi:hypothetical protein
MSCVEVKRVHGSSWGRKADPEKEARQFHHRDTEGTEKRGYFFQKALRGRFLKRGLFLLGRLSGPGRKKLLFSSFSLLCALCVSVVRPSSASSTSSERPEAKGDTYAGIS